MYDDSNNKERQDKAERVDTGMEKGMNTALEIGQRCRRMRQVQGISQQDLAKKLNTTPQNISRYETQGISNIDVIQKASEVLGHDLLQDEMDTEGTVGEIGIEILQLILKEHLESDSIIHGKLLYGLAPDRVIHELFKLEKIGLCVREQYTNFDGNFLYSPKVKAVHLCNRIFATLRFQRCTASVSTYLICVFASLKEDIEDLFHYSPNI